MIDWYEIYDINPIQWQTGVASAGRKNGKIVANRLSKSPELAVYQEAIKEHFENLSPPPPIYSFPSGIRLEFYFRQVREEWKNDHGRTVKRNRRDATNLQKALEDALQGVLYVNDSLVVDVRTVVETVSPGGPTSTPFIGIGIGPATPGDFYLEFGRRSWTH